MGDYGAHTMAGSWACTRDASIAVPAQSGIPFGTTATPATSAHASAGSVK